MSEHSLPSTSELYEYVGFWARVGATIIDSLIVGIIIYPLLIWIYGWGYFEDTAIIRGSADLLISWIFPFAAVVAFWIIRQATPGKMAIAAKIVDAETGKKPSTKQHVLRYLGYFISFIPCGLGIFWVGWDKRKQGWHDKIAGTVVIRLKNRVEAVKFQE